MADISKITILSGTYDIKDEISREKVNKVAYNNIFVGTFFDSDTLTIHFVTSLDGQNWSEFNKGVHITGVRDPQLIYNPNNNTFYLSATKSGTGYNFVIYTSTDFENWTLHNIDLGFNTACWAPELFLDGENLYLTISVGELGAMKIHLLECTDIDNLTFDNDSTLPLNIEDVIDASLIKYNGVYYLTVKDNTTAKQIIYLSTNLLTFSVINNDVLGMDVECEGGQLLNINGRWYFYGDTWYNYGLYGYMQTDDITNFGYLIPNGLSGLRHGSVLYLTDRNAINTVTDVSDYNTTSKIQERNRLVLLEGSYDKLVILPDFLYRINGTTTITEIINPYNIKYVSLMFTAPRSATLTLPLGTANTATTIYNSYSNNEKLMVLNLQDKRFINGGRIKKTIAASDLWTVNDNEEWSVTLYDSILSDNILHLTFSITKLVDSATVHPITLKAPFVPLNPTPVNNDKGLSMYIRSNGTMFNSNSATKDEATYCYMEFEIE